MAVCFYFEKSAPLRQRTRLKEFITALLKKEGKKLNYLNYIFCSDARLLGINKEYLNHNYYTDIITFDLSEAGGGISGEIYISIDRVRDNAKKLCVPVNEELHRVIFHGQLHLLGYKDKTKLQAEKMRTKENEYLNKYFRTVPRGTKTG